MYMQALSVQPQFFCIYRPVVMHCCNALIIITCIINDWNGLPYDSVNVHSTNLFKTHLDRFYYDYQYDIV